MDEFVPFGSREYFGFLSLMFFGRGMDFLSTWIATPNLLLEANPVARRLRWRLGIPVNMLLCVGFAVMPLTAIIIVTTSVLVAARNFQLAWLMRSYGEENYRSWFLERLDETPPSLFLFCLLAQSLLTAAIGGVLMYFSHGRNLVPLGIGMGVIGYAAAVVIYSGLALWRHRRVLRDKS
jgi:hypothetical protein